MLGMDSTDTAITLRIVEALDRVGERVCVLDQLLREQVSTSNGLRRDLQTLRADHQDLVARTRDGAQFGAGLLSLGEALSEHAKAAISLQENAPAPVVNVTVPRRRTEGSVERDAQGRVARTTTIETDL